MTTLKVEALVREFHYNGTRIPDPAPRLDRRTSPRFAI